MDRFTGIAAGERRDPILHAGGEWERADEFGEDDLARHGADSGDGGHMGDGVVDHLLVGGRAADDGVAAIDADCGPAEIAGTQRGSDASLKIGGDGGAGLRQSEGRCRRPL